MNKTSAVDRHFMENINCFDWYKYSFDELAMMLDLVADVLEPKLHEEL